MRGYFNYKAVELVLQGSNQRGVNLLVLISIAKHSNEKTDLSWVSQWSIAFEARASRKGVQLVLPALVASGELELVRKGGKGRGDHDVFRLNLDQLGQQAEERKRAYSVRPFDGGDGGTKGRTLFPKRAYSVPIKGVASTPELIIGTNNKLHTHAAGAADAPSALGCVGGLDPVKEGNPESESGPGSVAPPSAIAKAKKPPAPAGAVAKESNAHIIDEPEIKAAARRPKIKRRQAGSAAPVLTTWPEGLALTRDMRQEAFAAGIPAEKVDEAFRRFHDDAIAKGRRYADWVVRWAGFCRSTHQQDLRNGAAPSGPPAGAGKAIKNHEQWAREHAAEIKRTGNLALLRKTTEGD